MTRTQWGLLVAMLWSGATVRAGEAGVRLVDVRNGKPLPSGIQIVQVRMTPTVTTAISRMVFICKLRQQFPYKGSDGKDIVRTIEPAEYVHREEKVRLTADLDYHVFIRVPLREEDLVKAYGKRTFRSGIPVTVSSVRIEAKDDAGQTVWSVDAPMDQVTRLP